jgi:hypothetical protein
MDSKLILFDIDGTLLDHDKKLPESTKVAIEKLKELGHSVGIATGRAPFMFESLRNELNIDTYISMNGQFVVYKDQVVFKNPIDKETIQKLINYSEKISDTLGFTSHKDLFVNANGDIRIQKSIESLKMGYPEINSTYWRDEEIYQILLFNENNEELKYKDVFDNLQFVRWHDCSSDVMPKGGSKANGIKQLVLHLGFDLNDVYAFGDGLNDFEMLSYVPNSVAMGNGHESIKSIAKHITTDVDKDGILNGLKKLKLL